MELREVPAGCRRVRHPVPARRRAHRPGAGRLHRIGSVLTPTRAAIAAFAVASSVALLAGALGPVSAPARAALAPGGTFIDDDGSVHEGWIEAIADAGLTTGCTPDGLRYCPDDPLTRGQMATLLVRARPERFPASAPDAFADDGTSVHHDAINRAAAAGVTVGCAPDRYCPTSPVTRGQMASFIVTTFDLEAAGGDRFTDDDGSVHEANIDTVAAAGIAVGCAPDRFCPLHAVTRAQVATLLGKAMGLTEMVPPPPPVPVLAQVASGLDRPTHVASPPGDARLFVTQQGGAVRLITPEGGLAEDPFLDLTGQVLFTGGGERGLFAIAFHPDFATNGRFYVNYSRAGTGTATRDHQTWVDEFTLADPGASTAAGAARRTILMTDQPRSNHNGGQIAFGPDGMFYLGLGDGGGSFDPDERAEDPTHPLGAIHRYELRGDGAVVPRGRFHGGTQLPVLHSGLRNPWRFSFDEPTGRMLIGDVGQGSREEIDRAGFTPGDAADFGWDRYEGSMCAEGPCDPTGLTFPIHEYSHDLGRSITGGFVYRGSLLPRLRGHYFYGDFVTSIVGSFDLSTGVPTDHRDWTDTLGGGGVASFGLDRDGELYLAKFDGTISKVVPSG